MSLRLGVVAKSVEQANHWLETCQLHQLSDWDYQTFVWPADTSATSLDTRLHGLIWLWEQVHSGEAEKEQERWRSFLAACLTCFPKAVPIIIVASGDVTQAGKAQLREMVKQLRKAYVRSWHGWMPVEFADRSRITMQVKDAAGALRLLQHFSELKRDLQRWQEKAHVQAERCLTLGVLLTTVYLALLAATLFWKSTPSADRSSDPLVWVKKDWQYHLTDVRQMLSQMGNKSLQELTAPELQRFNQHLRWLPVSLDMLKQRRPTRELLYYRASVEEVLQSMEKI
ncbi:MAG TPA: hypothetical protein PKA06_02180, partial [Gemmatales bacterium]|nr:hypothetical protein [Gemmatales bacterium]